MAEYQYAPMTTRLTDLQTAAALCPPPTSMHSPFRYVGGKFWIRREILSLLPPHQFYIEPFAGGGSVFFLKGGGERAQLNDLDAELMNCYACIRDHAEALIERLMPLDVHRDTHRRLRAELKSADGLDRAARYFFLNHTSFAGITNLRGCYWGTRSPLTATHTGWAKRIRRASALLQGVHLTNQDFEAVIDAAPDGAFLFVDAPYRSARHYKYYAHIFSWEDHVRLAACLERHSRRLRFLASYDDCTQVRDLYAWAAYVEAVPRPNRIERTDNKIVTGGVPPQRSVGRDLLIRNYEGPSHKWTINSSHGVGSGSDFVALADEQWAAVEPLLPPLPRRADDKGRPWRDSREVLDGILWVLSRDARWNTLPPGRYPPFQTCHRRYLRWRADGTLLAVMCALEDIGGPALSHMVGLSALKTCGTSG